MTTAYRQGRDFEYRVIADLENDGYRCTRAAGSKGTADIVALKPGQVLLVQAKLSAPPLPPSERRALLALVAYLQAPGMEVVPLAVHKPERGQPLQYRKLTGPLAADWVPWTADQVGDAA